MVAKASKTFSTLAKVLDESVITKGIRSVDPFLIGFGDRLQQHVQSVGPRRKYMTELILRLPLVFIVHQWLLLSPTSSYKFIEVFLFVIRLLGAILLLGIWQFPFKTMLRVYIAASIDIVFGWILQLNHLMYQNEAEGICDPWWGEREVPWWPVAVSTMIFQLLYFLYLIQKYNACANLNTFDACIITATLVPHVLCMTSVFIGTSASVFYWLTKAFLILTTFAQIVYYYENAGIRLRELSQEQRNQLNPGKWFMRDLLVVFTLIYYSLGILIVVVSAGPFHVLTMSYLTSFPGSWCTSLVIVAGLSACLGFLSNLLVALSRYLVTGEKEFAAAVFDVNIGGRVNLAMIFFCLEAGILTVSDEVRIQNFKSVLFLTFYVILAQVWDMTEQQCHVITNSGENRTIVAYLRVLVFAALISLIPTIVTFKAASYLQVDLWLLLNASGTILILCRAVCSLLELILGSLAWHVDNNLDKLEDLIYLMRILKNLTTVMASVLIVYYRLQAPFFSGWFVIRFGFACCEVIGVAKFIVYKEWIGFQNRRKFLNRLSTVPDANEEQLRELNDVCSICFAEMNEGKVLQCSHIFHKACLRKWFQLQTTCPLCNTSAF